MGAKKWQMIKINEKIVKLLELSSDGPLTYAGIICGKCIFCKNKISLIHGGFIRCKCEFDLIYLFTHTEQLSFHYKKYMISILPELNTTTFRGKGNRALDLTTHDISILDCTTSTDIFNKINLIIAIQ